MSLILQVSNGESSSLIEISGHIQVRKRHASPEHIFSRISCQTKSRRLLGIRNYRKRFFPFDKQICYEYFLLNFRENISFLVSEGSLRSFWILFRWGLISSKNNLWFELACIKLTHIIWAIWLKGHFMKWRPTPKLTVLNVYEYMGALGVGGAARWALGRFGLFSASEKSSSKRSCSAPWD